MSTAHAEFRPEGTHGYVVPPRPHHPAYDAQWIHWRDEARGLTYAVPMHAPRRLVAAASMKPGSTLSMTRPDDSVVWHPHLDI